MIWPTFTDAGSLGNPVVGSIEGLGKFVVGDDSFGYGNAPTLETNSHV